MTVSLLGLVFFDLGISISWISGRGVSGFAHVM